MCYILYLSTTSQEDLSRLPSSLYAFRSVTAEDDLALVELLEHPVRWYIQSQYGGCSCHFRHLSAGNDMDFAPPTDWFPEDADDIEATQALYDVVFDLLKCGHSVDLLDAWEDTAPSAITIREVSLSKIGRDAFRLFEGIKLNFIPCNPSNQNREYG